MDFSNKKVDAELAWERFSTTGKVSDYMIYKNAKTGAATNSVQNGEKDDGTDRGDNTKIQTNG